MNDPRPGGNKCISLLTYSELSYLKFTSAVEVYNGILRKLSGAKLPGNVCLLASTMS